MAADDTDDRGDNLNVLSVNISLTTSCHTQPFDHPGHQFVDPAGEADPDE